MRISIGYEGGIRKYTPSTREMTKRAAPANDLKISEYENNGSISVANMIFQFPFQLH